MELFVIFALGLCVGSFANVLVDRLPLGQGVLWGRSHCDHCRRTLRWFELVPLVSYILQRGRCLRCHTPLSLQYPLVELVSGVGFAFLWSLYGVPLPFLIRLTLFVPLLVIFTADLKYQVIPDSMVVVAGIAALAYGMVLGSPQPMGNYLLAALGASLFFFFLWRATRGRGLGFGDVKLAFVLGLFLGYPTVIFALYVAFLTGAAVGVILILAGQKSLKSKIAFGPFLIAGCMVSLYWSGVFNTWWRNLW